MADPREKHEHDPHDPRGGSTNPTGPQGTDEQARWQQGKFGEAARRDETTKAATARPKPDTE